MRRDRDDLYAPCGGHRFGTTSTTGSLRSVNLPRLKLIGKRDERGCHAIDVNHFTEPVDYDDGLIVI